MELEEWKENIIQEASGIIAFKDNVSDSEIERLHSVLLSFLNSGIVILKQWLKIKDENEFTSGEYDTYLVQYIHDKYDTNGAEAFSMFSSNSTTFHMGMTPENKLRSSIPQKLF